MTEKDRLIERLEEILESKENISNYCTPDFVEFMIKYVIHSKEEFNKAAMCLRDLVASDNESTRRTANDFLDSYLWIK